MINLEFADVETVMSSMGKAMMGTGEAEGENRAMAATEMALNNPLIDEYSLQGAKGLLINITGGNDLTLFEVDQSVNKIRAEVDPEAELIFGAIKDESMTGKIRVSIVATALDGHKTDNKTVLNMVSRIQNRNTGYSENLFSQSPRIENNAISSIDGATALKLDESFQLEEQEHVDLINHTDNNLLNESNLENSINQAYNDLKGAIKLFEASNKTLESLKNAFEDASDRFSIGAVNSFDFIQSKQRYESAASENIRAKFDYIFKLKVLEFYFGLPLSIPQSN